MRISFRNMFSAAAARMGRAVAAWCLLALAGCGGPAEGLPEAPDYACPESWYGGLEANPGHGVDIFYVYPTSGSAPADADGEPALYTDVSDSTERLAAESNLRYNRGVYAAGDYNFFAPYYRQLTMAAYRRGAAAADSLAAVPAQDVRRAFRYYMEHLNGGRPFMLLGHSQGSSMLLELLAEGVTDEEFDRMIAAYLFGCRITAERLAAAPQRIRPARGRDDVGVAVVFNSLSDPSARSPWTGEPAVCINPVNWRTDSVPSLREEHLGAIRFDRQLGAYATRPALTRAWVEGGFLICPDIDPAECYREEFADLFPRGNLHFMDSWLFSADIRANMAERTAAYRALKVGRNGR